MVWKLFDFLLYIIPAYIDLEVMVVNRLYFTFVQAIFCLLVLNTCMIYWGEATHNTYY